MKPGTEAHRSLIAGNPFVEMDANEVSADRVWLRRSPIGCLCIGLGSSAKLARFAFENVAPKRPFYSACRRIERDVAREGLAKARRLGLSIPFDAFEDNALRRIAIASALLKAGFDPEEQRDKDGEWTTGGAGAAAARVSPGFLPKPPPTSLLGPIPPGVKSALGVLAARALAAVAVFRILFIPSNQSLITQGTAPDRPDIRFTYDGGEGGLTIHRDGADGSTYGFSAKPGPDGVFRDDQGRAFARRLDDGTVVIDPDILPSADSGPSTRNEQPKLCPDPGPDIRRGLEAEDGTIDPDKVDEAARYQAYISKLVNPTNPLPIGLAVSLTNPVTGDAVTYDDCRRSDGTMIEAKYGHLKMMENEYQTPWEKDLLKMSRQAQNQVAAAGGRDIEWYFSEKKVADFMATYFGDKNLPIKVIHVPAPW